MAFTKEHAKQTVEQLVNDFESRKDYYFKTDEANIETKLIEPLFEALGWTNDELVYKLYGISEEEKKIIEASLK